MLSLTCLENWITKPILDGCELEIQWNNLGFHNFQIVYFGFHAFMLYFIAVRCPMVFIGLRLST